MDPKTADLPPTSAPAAPLTFEQFWAERYAVAYQEALAQERQWQEESFAECTHTVAGLELRPMSLDDFLLLSGLGNAFVAGGPITGETIAQFITVLVEPAPRGWWARRRFFRHLAAQPYARTVEQIRTYVRRMFVSAEIALVPPTGAAGPAPASDAPQSAPALATHFVAPLIVHLAAELHWSETEIRALPLDKLFQYRRALAAREGTASAYPAADRLLSEALTAYSAYLAPQASPLTPL